MAQNLSNPRAAALNYLSSRQNEDGGWGYLSTHPSTVEPTAIAAIAVTGSHDHSTATQRAMQWLQHVQHANGGWGISVSDPESSWQTAWAMLALTKTSTTYDVIERGNKWLLEMEQLAVTDELQRDMQKISSIDLTLRGWPWHPLEASWVEPTSLALMALNSSAYFKMSAGRIETAVQYLLNRRCGTGGWNVGSPIMLGAALPARAVPSALALLALALHAPDSILADDIAALRTDMTLDGGALATALGLIALRQLGQTDENAMSALHKIQSEDGSWNQDVFHTALALIAIREPFCPLWERCN